MKIRCHGSIGGNVTGSMHEFKDEARGVHGLVDCGMLQGEAAGGGTTAFPFDPAELTHVLLTHAHLDHCGRLPELYIKGYTGDVLCSPETAELTRLNLRSAASFTSAFGVKDVDRIRFRSPADPFFSRPHKLAEDVTCTATISSHILGACGFQLSVRDPDGFWRSAHFSGDVGANTQTSAPLPLLRAGQTPYVWQDNEDLVVVESTYGARDKAVPSAEDRRAALRAELHRVTESGGALIIPAFSIERTQDVLFDLHVLMHDGGSTPVPVLFDSPLAAKVAKVFSEHLGRTEIVKSSKDGKKAREVWRNAEELERLGLDPDQDFPVFVEMVRLALGVRKKRLPVLTACKVPIAQRWQSRIVSERPASGPVVIVAGAGMCVGGRVVQHLRERLGDENTVVALVGYAAAETPARRLLDLESLAPSERRKVSGTVGLCDGRDVALSSVRARIVRIDGYSGHGNQTALLDWLFPAIGDRPRECAGSRVVLVHGQAYAQRALRKAIRAKADELGVRTPTVTLADANTGWMSVGAASTDPGDPLVRAAAAARASGDHDLADALMKLAS